MWGGGGGLCLLFCLQCRNVFFNQLLPHHFFHYADLWSGTLRWQSWEVRGSRCLDTYSLILEHFLDLLAASLLIPEHMATGRPIGFQETTKLFALYSNSGILPLFIYIGVFFPTDSFSCFCPPTVQPHCALKLWKRVTVRRVVLVLLFPSFTCINSKTCSFLKQIFFIFMHILLNIFLLHSHR